MATTTTTTHLILAAAVAGADIRTKEMQSRRRRMAAYSRISWSVSDADEPGTRCETVATTTAAMRTAAEGRRFVTTAAAASTRCEIVRSRIRTLRLPSVSSAIKSDTCRGIVRRIRAGCTSTVDSVEFVKAWTI